MVGKSKPARGQDKERLQIPKAHCPCICCLLTRDRTRLPEVHHIVEGQTRLGHAYSYSMCEYHHRGMLHEGLSRQEHIGMIGPSLAYGSKPFVEFFGTQGNLLRLQDIMLDSFHDSPWLDYDVPYLVRRELHQSWIRSK